MIADTPHTDFWKIKLDRPVFLTVVIYLSLAAFLEILGTYVSITLGSIGNALLIFLAINQAVWMHNTACYRILPVIALIPFLRLLSVILPVAGWPIQINYLLITIPLLVTVGMLMYYRKIPLVNLGLERPNWRVQFPIALSGLPLGFIGYLLLRPTPLFVGSGLVVWTTNLLVLFVCIAFAEEIVFRGIFLRVLAEVSDPFALFASGLLYGVLHIGSGSLAYALFMGLVGWLFAFLTLRTRSIWGVVIAHFFLVAGMVLFSLP